MTALVWDETGQRMYETGVDRGVLYIPDNAGAYDEGVAWNGLVSVTESPSGAEPNPQYADNIKYLNLTTAEEFGATLEAYMYPDEFNQFDGLASPTPGVTIGQQGRKTFGLCYRTKVGNDTQGVDYGYKLHLVYGCQATPSEKAYTTINDSPEAITFSWDLTTTPVAVDGHKPTAILTIDSKKVSATALAQLERQLYGDAGVDPALPLPTAVIAMFAGNVTEVSPQSPTFDDSTDTLTIPNQVGVRYYKGGVAQDPGPQVITGPTVIEARPNTGYVFAAGVDDDWRFVPTPPSA